MVVHDFYIVRVRFGPTETDSILTVNSDAKLTFAFALQRFQSIPRRNPQIVEARGIVEHPKLPQGHALQVCWQATTSPRKPQLFTFVVGETLDHAGEA